MTPPESQPDATRSYNLSGFRQIAGVKGTEGGPAKITVLQSLIRQSEAHRIKALTFCYQSAAYRHNKFEYQVTPDENGVPMLQQDINKTGVEKVSIPWSLGKFQLRLAVYSAFAPQHDIAIGAGQGSDRATGEICTALDHRRITQEIDRIRLTRCDMMAAGCHTVVKVVFDPTLGMNSREPVTGQSKTVVGMDNRVVGEPGEVLSAYPVGKPARVPTKTGVFKLNDAIEETTTYHLTDELGRKQFNARKTGDVRLIPLSAVEFNYDPQAKHGLRDARYAYDQRRVLADTLFSLYPNRTKELESVGWWSSELVLSSTERQIWSITGKQTTNPDVHTAVLTDFYMRPSAQFGFPKGLHAVWASRDATGEGLGEKCILLEWGEWNHDSLRRVYCEGAVEIYDSDDWWGSNYLRASAPAQALTNELNSLGIDSVKRGTNTVIAIEEPNAENPGVLASAIDGLPGGIAVKIGTRVGAVKSISTQDSGDRQFAVADRIMRQEEMVSNTRTAESANTNLATEIQRAMQQDKSVTSMVLTRLNRQDQDIKVAAFCCYQEHCRVEDLQLFLPEFVREEIVDFINADIESSAKLEMRGSLLSEDPTFIFTLLKFLPQFGDEWKSIWPPQVLADLLASERKFGKTPRDDERELQQRENSILRRGDPKRPCHGFWLNDHATHRTEIRAYVAKNYLWMNANELDRFRAHDEEHEMFERKQAVEKAKQAMMGQLEVEMAKGKIAEAAGVAQGATPAPMAQTPASGQGQMPQPGGGYARA